MGRGNEGLDRTVATKMGGHQWCGLVLGMMKLLGLEKLEKQIQREEETEESNSTHHNEGNYA